MNPARTLSQKYDDLISFIEEKGCEGVVIAFSGGVDSSTLAAICRKVLGERVVAATAKSVTYPQEELADARRVAEEIGLKHYIFETNELCDHDFVRNPENRCYYCKKVMLHELRSLADQLGLKSVFEGTNFSDLGSHRPGFKAVTESSNVFSPWVATGFTKVEIRTLAKQTGLPVHSKLALACLASRIPYGERITKEKLERVGKAEAVVRRISGVRELRVRDHNGLARIEVGRNERTLLFSEEIMDKISKELKELGFKFVAFDMEGYRTGSMLAGLT
jgi:uncharacterized protein